jgi:hypothetical protein
MKTCLKYKEQAEKERNNGKPTRNEPCLVIKRWDGRDDHQSQ